MRVVGRSGIFQDMAVFGTRATAALLPTPLIRRLRRHLLPQGETGQFGQRRASFLLPLWEKVAERSEVGRGVLGGAGFCRTRRCLALAPPPRFFQHPSSVAFGDTFSHRGEGQSWCWRSFLKRLVWSNTPHPSPSATPSPTGGEKDSPGVGARS